MDTYKETFETWNQLASLYSEKFMNLNLYNETYDYLSSLIAKQDAKILELGCGPGNITKYLLSNYPQFEILGVDVAPNMIAIAKEHNPKATFIELDIRHIDTIHSTFDAIISGFCLPYLSHEDGIQLLKNSYNLLNANGLFYLSFVEGKPNESKFQVASTGHRSYFYFYQLDELIAQLANNHFELVKIFKVEYLTSANKIDIHTIVITKKITH